ncbi:MAG: selenium-dependent molybdenum cofactor biosynthesis protein YqeB [Eubacteriales bacterium]|nr:selenium-dependent molybdenum cofactor biosynthesis protein YqeB [Eubacteriales bacterium]
MSEKKIVVVRGGGDLASGVIHRLYRCGYRVLVLESPNPSAIRRMVSFCEAVYDGEAFVEGVLSCLAKDLSQCQEIWERREIPVLVDPEGKSIDTLKKEGRLLALVDAILAKKNLGTRRDMAPFTIALGPGFCAGDDVDVVIETMRGHDLGRIIEEGWAVPNTGIPGIVGGVGSERVIHSPCAGTIKNEAKIADLVTEGQVIAKVGDTPIPASLTGVLRGLIRDGYAVYEGMKIADIDPRKEEKENCYTISDKARCIGGGVLEALLSQGLLP